MLSAVYPNNVIEMTMLLAENRRLLLKAGINKWQDIEVLDMRRSDELNGMYGCDWWCIELSFDEVSLFIKQAIS